MHIRTATLRFALLAAGMVAASAGARADVLRIGLAEDPDLSILHRAALSATVSSSPACATSLSNLAEGRDRAVPCNEMDSVARQEVPDHEAPE